MGRRPSAALPSRSHPHVGVLLVRGNHHDVGGENHSSSTTADETVSPPMSSSRLDHGPNGATCNAEQESDNDDGQHRTYRGMLSGKALHDGEVPLNLRNTSTTCSSSTSNDAGEAAEAEDLEVGAALLLLPDDPPVAVAEPVRWSPTTGSSAEYDDDVFVIFGPTGEVQVEEEVPWAPSHPISSFEGLHRPPPINEPPPPSPPKSSRTRRRALWLSLTVAVAVTTVLLVTAVAVTLAVRRSAHNDASSAAASEEAAPPSPVVAPPTMAPSQATAGGGDIPVMYEHLTAILYAAFPGEKACHTYAISGESFYANFSKKRDVAARQWLECNATHRFASAEESTMNYVDGRPLLSLFVEGRWTVQCDYDPVVGNCTADVAEQEHCICAPCTTLDGDFGLHIPCLQDGDCMALSWLANPWR